MLRLHQQDKVYIFYYFFIIFLNILQKTITYKKKIIDKQNLLKKARDDADLEVQAYKERKEQEFQDYKRNVCLIFRTIIYYDYLFFIFFFFFQIV